MKNKIIAFILVFNFSLLLLSPIYSKADDLIFGGTDVTVLPDATQITNNSLDFFIGSLLNGATYDLTGTDPEYLADNFLYDVGSSVWEWLVYQRVTNGDANYNEDYTFTYLDNEGLENITTTVNLVPVSGANRQRALQWLNYIRNNIPSDAPIPNPDPDYMFYINQINYDGFFWKDYSGTYALSPGYNQIADAFPFYDYSWVAYNGSSDLNLSANIIVDDNNARAYASAPLDINIVPYNNQYQINVTVHPVTSVAHNAWNNEPFNSLYFYHNYDRFSGYNYTFYPSLTGLYTGSLIECFSWMVYRFRNVNIYVDGEPWSIISDPHHYIPIGKVVIDPDNPVDYVYPTPVYFDPTEIIERLQDLIDLKVTISLPDFEDLIVDVNGQRAWAVLNVVRNDYDTLVDEQFTYYPQYPNFRIHDEYNSIIEGGVQVINVSASVVPDDLLDCIIYCGILILFGLVVRRFIE